MTSSTKFKVGDRVWVAVDVKNGQGNVTERWFKGRIVKPHKNEDVGKIKKNITNE